MFKPLRWLPVLMAFALAACGSGLNDSTTAAPATTLSTSPTTPETAAPVTTSDPGFPVTVQAANGQVTIESRPQAIVSLSPTATEMLFAVGAGDQVIAVDEFSYYPEEAPVTDLSGFTPNIEAIVSYDPDLVVVSDDIDSVVAGLSGLGVTVVHLPAAATMDDVYGQIGTIGEVTGHAAEADALAQDMRSRVEGLVASTPRPQVPISFFHEIDNTLYSASSATFVGHIYGLLGLENIADAVDTSESSGYPQLSAEYIIERDPDIIFLADALYGESPETVAARPGWGDLRAVRDGLVIPVDADIASRWGPRIVDFLEVVAAAVDQRGGS